MITIPPYLKKGDCIGIVAPAGYMPFGKMENCINTLQDWGYTVELGDTTNSSSQNYFSGTDAERLADVQQMLDDRDVHAVLCARGGYGMGRIVDQINFKKFKKHPKWIVGFSDVTVLLSHVYNRFKIASLHAPMAAAFNDGGFANAYVLSLKNALEGVPAYYECSTNALNRAGKATAELVGGNLTLLTHLIATPSDIKTKHKILFIEDVGEHLYSIDRMFLQLRRSGRLRKLAGLIVGGFTEMKDTDRPFGNTVQEIIQEHVSDYQFPVCFDFPVSHGLENYALKIGGTYTLHVNSHAVTLEEVTASDSSS